MTFTFIVVGFYFDFSISNGAGDFFISIVVEVVGGQNFRVVIRLVKPSEACGS